MERGKVKKIVGDKGFGFIRPAGNDGDVFFHHSVVADEGFNELAEGQDVEYELTFETKGKGPRAGHVQPVK